MCKRVALARHSVSLHNSNYLASSEKKKTYNYAFVSAFIPKLHSNAYLPIQMFYSLTAKIELCIAS